MYIIIINIIIIIIIIIIIRILSRPCNDWSCWSLNESIFTVIGEDFCQGLRMSFWDFGFHVTAHKNNRAHLALFDCC